MDSSMKLRLESYGDATAELDVHLPKILTLDVEDCDWSVQNVVMSVVAVPSNSEEDIWRRRLSYQVVNFGK